MMGGSDKSNFSEIVALVYNISRSL